MANLISLGQLIDQTIEHYREHYKELLGIALWMLVAFTPVIIASLLTPTTGEYSGLAQGLSISGLNFLGIIAVAVTSIWVAITMILAIDAQSKGKSVDVKAIGRQAWNFFLPFAFVSALIALIAIGLSLLAVPGIVIMMTASMFEEWTVVLGFLGGFLFFTGGIAAIALLIRLSVEFSFAQYILLFESKPSVSWNNLVGVLKKSRALVKGRWWATATRFIVANLLFSLIVFGINFVLSIGSGVLFAVAVGSLSPVFLLIGGAIITLLVYTINVLAMPLYSLATYFLYDSLTKTR